MAENRVERNNYITLQGWMLTDLGLKGNELIIYACIYGFSQLEGQAFTGSLRYLADWTNTTKQSVIRCLKSLVEKGYIVKTDKVINGVKFCEYHATKLGNGIQETCTGYSQNVNGAVTKCERGIQVSLPNNLEDKLEDKLEDNIGVTTEQSPSYEGSCSSVTLTREENRTTTGNDERPDFNTVEVYASNNLEWLSPQHMAELGDFKTEFPDEVIKHAIDEACANGARRWGYVRQMLIRWGEQGVRTLGDAKAAQDRFRAGKQRQEERKRNYDPDRPGAVMSKCLM